jgi:hypothetical protein
MPWLAELLSIGAQEPTFDTFQGIVSLAARVYYAVRQQHSPLIKFAPPAEIPPPASAPRPTKKARAPKSATSTRSTKSATPRRPERPQPRNDSHNMANQDKEDLRIRLKRNIAAATAPRPLASISPSEFQPELCRDYKMEFHHNIQTAGPRFKILPEKQSAKRPRMNSHH